MLDQPGPSSAQSQSAVADQPAADQAGEILRPRIPITTARAAGIARHGRRRWPPLALAGVLVLVVAIAVAGLRFIPGAPLANAAEQTAGQWQSGASLPQTTPSPEASPTLPPLAVAATEVRLDVDGWWSWALLDQRTGEINGSVNLAETSTTASLIKAWIAADYLRRAAQADSTPDDYRMYQLEIMIRDSDNAVAEQLWQEIGRSAAIDRMIDICELTDSSSTENRWSTTLVSPRDVARLGACIADGRAAGPTWTNWLLTQMRTVRSPGDFGVLQAFDDDEAAGIAIKNGWVIRDEQQQWHVNCLAIGDGWTLGVMVRFPTSHDFSYGGQVCRDVTAQLRAAAAAAAATDDGTGAGLASGQEELRSVSW